MKILVTSAAGFIGYHLSKKLIETGNDVVGLDNINDYYDIISNAVDIEKFYLQQNK